MWMCGGAGYSGVGEISSPLSRKEKKPVLARSHSSASCLRTKHSPPKESSNREESGRRHKLSIVIGKIGTDFISPVLEVAPLSKMQGDKER